MDTKAKVGTRIRAIRRQRGKSQADIAEVTRRSVVTISSIERGKSLPNFDTLERLAEALEVPVKEFFAFDRRPVSVKREAAIAEINALLLALTDSEIEMALGLLKTLETHRQG